MTQRGFPVAYSLQNGAYVVVIRRSCYGAPVAGCLTTGCEWRLWSDFIEALRGEATA